MSSENNNEERKEVVPFWRSRFSELDKGSDNFKRDFEHTFAAEPLHLSDVTTACDLVDEGDKFVITADMPRIKK